jgi:two-component system, NarL family, response regulator NreC
MMKTIYAPITVVIADDHELYRDGLMLLLGGIENIHILGQACNGEQLVSIALEKKPDVILTDIKMPKMDGIKATTILSKELASAAVLALSMFDDEGQIIEMMEAGARGYLIKNAGKEEIVSAIIAVNNGLNYFCSTTNVKMAQRLGLTKFKGAAVKEVPPLSDIEKQIINLICAEKTSKEIGELMGMSNRTVEGHRLKLLDKLQVKSAAGIVIYAIQNKIVDIK